MFAMLLNVARHYDHKIFNTVFYMEVFYPACNRYKIKHKLFQYFESTFLKHLGAMVSLSSIEKNSIAIT